jgi:outer membrane protein TolC
LLAACTAGPDFARPKPPSQTDYVAGPPVQQTRSSSGFGGAPQYFLHGEDLPRGWWHWFESPAIVALVERAFASSPDLAAARARLRGAEAQLRAQRGLLLPEIGASGLLSFGNGGSGRGESGPDRGSEQPGQGDGGGAGGQPGDADAGTSGIGDAFTVYTAGANVSYDLDIAGRNRRLVEAALAEYER